MIFYIVSIFKQWVCSLATQTSLAMLETWHSDSQWSHHWPNWPSRSWRPSRPVDLRKKDHQRPPLKQSFKVFPNVGISTHMLMCSKVGNVPALLCLLSPQVHLSDPDECTERKREKQREKFHIKKQNSTQHDQIHCTPKSSAMTSICSMAPLRTIGPCNPMGPGGPETPFSPVGPSKPYRMRKEWWFQLKKILNSGEWYDKHQFTAF